MKGCCSCFGYAFGLFVFCGIALSLVGKEAAAPLTFLLFCILAWIHVNHCKREQLMKMTEDDVPMESSSFDESQDDDSMPVLVDGILVHEVDAIASRLKDSGISFSVERSTEDRSFVYGGHGGTGTQMRIRVNRADREKAVKVLDNMFTTTEMAVGKRSNAQ